MIKLADELLGSVVLFLLALSMLGIMAFGVNMSHAKVEGR
jgi:hypothetical protein